MVRTTHEAGGTLSRVSRDHYFEEGEEGRGKGDSHHRLLKVKTEIQGVTEDNQEN